MGIENLKALFKDDDYLDGVPCLYVGSIEADHGEYYANGPNQHNRYVLYNQIDGSVVLHGVSRESFVINEENH